MRLQNLAFLRFVNSLKQPINSSRITQKHNWFAYNGSGIFVAHRENRKRRVSLIKPAKRDIVTRRGRSYLQIVGRLPGRKEGFQCVEPRSEPTALMQDDLRHLVSYPGLDHVLVRRDYTTFLYDKPCSGIIDLDRRSRTVNRSLQVAVLINRHIADSVRSFVAKHATGAALNESITAYNQAYTRAVQLGNLLGESSHLLVCFAQLLDFLALLANDFLVLLAPQLNRGV